MQLIISKSRLGHLTLRLSHKQILKSSLLALAFDDGSSGFFVLPFAQFPDMDLWLTHKWV